MAENRQISIILPVHNQADHIERIVTEYVHALSKANLAYEMLLVVNHSGDDSIGICRKIERQYDAIRVIDLKEGGWGLAVKAGLQEARGELLCYTNSAHTSPQDLLLLLRYGFNTQNRVFKATRRMRKGVFRRCGSLVYNALCRHLFDLPYGDINGTPKVFPRNFGALLKLTRDDDLIDLEFSVACRNHGYPLVEVPIAAAARHGGKSTTTVKSAVHIYWNAFVMWTASRKGVR
jgi:glycosyltransferase involved in cell wall biosynthesis